MRMVASPTDTDQAVGCGGQNGDAGVCAPNTRYHGSPADDFPITRLPKNRDK